MKVCQSQSISSCTANFLEFGQRKASKGLRASPGRDETDPSAPLPLQGWSCHSLRLPVRFVSHDPQIRALILSHHETRDHYIGVLCYPWSHYPCSIAPQNVNETCQPPSVPTLLTGSYILSIRSKRFDEILCSTIPSPTTVSYSFAQIIHSTYITHIVEEETCKKYIHRMSIKACCYYHFISLHYSN